MKHCASIQQQQQQQVTNPRRGTTLSSFPYQPEAGRFSCVCLVGRRAVVASLHSFGGVVVLPSSSVGRSVVLPTLAGDGFSCVFSLTGN